MLLNGGRVGLAIYAHTLLNKDCMLIFLYEFLYSYLKWGFSYMCYVEIKSFKVDKHNFHFRPLWSMCLNLILDSWPSSDILSSPEAELGIGFRALAPPKF